MRSEPKKRIDTHADATPLGGLGDAFAGLRVPDDLPAAPPAPPAAEPDAPHWKPGRVVLRRERAHRGGKTVIVIDGFATHLPAAFIERVAKTVRAACGCGGTVRGRSVEIRNLRPSRESPGRTGGEGFPGRRGGLNAPCLS